MQGLIFGLQRSILNLRNKLIGEDFQMFKLVNSIFELQADIDEILAIGAPNGLGQAQPMGQMSLKIENF
jgi:hypothetical protein